MGNKSKSAMNKIMDEIHFKIKSNQNILKLLMFDDKTVDIYEQPDLSRKESLEVTKNRIFTRKKMPDKDEMSCYITMWYGIKNYHQRKNTGFNGNTFNIRITCHNDLITNDHVGDRVCEIENIIEFLFDDKDIGAVCKCHVIDSEDGDINGTDYSGRHITIRFSDINGVNNE